MSPLSTTSTSRPLATDEQPLVQHLLGLLSDEDAERLDELSIADDESAWRLRVVENDLIDSYVRGALGGETLERFESFYLSSPRRRESVRFARSFLRAVDRIETSVEGGVEQDPTAVSATDQTEARPSGEPPRDRMPRRWTPSARLAALAALVLLAFGTLVFQAVRLRNGLREAQGERVALDRRTRALDQQLAEQRAANATVVNELERARESLATMTPRPSAAETPGRAVARAELMTALVLMPPTRAGGPVPTLIIPSGADRVAVDLRLESDDFPHYQASLTDPASNQTLWRSSLIAARSSGNAPTVSVVVPVNGLRPQHYSLTLTGRSAAGAAEIVGGYTFRVVRP